MIHASQTGSDCSGYTAAMDPARQRRILRQHLETDRLLGVSAVPIASVRPTMPAQATVPVEASPSVPAPLKSAVESLLKPASTPAVARSTEEKRVVLTQIDQQEVQGCTRCELHVSRTQTVFGEGDPDAQLMIIGEGPGADEDRVGRPFVGKAGQLLDKQIAAMGFEREQVYIANVVKCRPPANRTPTPIEAQTCGDYLHRQIATVQPKVILTVGGPAAKLLLGTDTGITRLRGQWHQYDAIDPAIPVMPTFHPAYLLRAYTKDNRAKVWDDLQAVVAKLKGS